MNTMLKSKYLLSMFFVYAIVTDVIICKRGGGGGGGGGSRGGSISRSGSSSRAGVFSGGSRSGIGSRYPAGSRFGAGAWTGVATGLLAYGIMSNLAFRRPNYGYGYGNDYYYRSTPRRNLGSFCTNMEDFNGTVIGKFQCPIDGFTDDSTYCCGPTNYQYCCKFFDDTGRTSGIIFAVLAFIGIIVCSLYFICKCIRKRPRSKQPNTNIHQIYNPPQFAGPSPINNYQPRPQAAVFYTTTGPQQQQQPLIQNALQSQPKYPTNSALPYPPLTNDNKPNHGLPYPITDEMPKSSLPSSSAPYPTQTTIINPPLYSDIMRSDHGRVENEAFLPKP